MRLRSLIIALLFAAPVMGQIPDTTVQGKIYISGGETGPVVATGGTIRATLSDPGSVLEGSTSQRVAPSRANGTIGADGSVTLSLVPNDAMTPSGTYWEVRISTTGPVRASWVEKWSITTTPDPVDIGSITRLQVAPGITVGSFLRYVLSEPSGTCLDSEGPVIETDTNQVCECDSGSWSCSAPTADSNATQIQGRNVCTDVPTDGQPLTYDATEGCYKPVDAGSGVTAGTKTDIEVVGPDSDWQIVDDAVDADAIADGAVGDSEAAAELARDLEVRTVFRVDAYGAIAGDGLDDTAAYTSAKEAAFAAGGDEVYFPPGIWNISNAALRQDTAVRGAGQSATIIDAFTDAAPVFVGQSLVTRWYYPTASHMTIRCINGGVTASEAFDLGPVNYANLHDLTLNGCADYGIRIYGDGASETALFNTISNSVLNSMGDVGISLEGKANNAEIYNTKVAAASVAYQFLDSDTGILKGGSSESSPLAVTLDADSSGNSIELARIETGTGIVDHGDGTRIRVGTWSGGSLDITGSGTNTDYKYPDGTFSRLQTYDPILADIDSDAKLNTHAVGLVEINTASAATQVAGDFLVVDDDGTLNRIDFLDASQVSAALGVVVGTDVQAHSDDLDDISALTCDPGEVQKWSGTAWACAADDASSGSGVTENTKGDIQVVGSDDDWQIVAGTVGPTEIGTDGVSADELNATGVESELEAVLDLPDLQGELTAAGLAADSVSAEELNATGVESELEAVLDLPQLQGVLINTQLPADLQAGTTVNASPVLTEDGYDSDGDGKVDGANEVHDGTNWLFRLNGTTFEWDRNGDGSADVTYNGTWSQERVAVPCRTFGDSDTTDQDVNGQICLDCTAIGSGAEDCDLVFSVQVSGAMTEIFRVDASTAGGQVQFGTDVEFPAGSVDIGDINASGSASGSTALCGDGSWGTCGITAGGGHPVADGTSIVEGSVDATKEVRIEVDGLTTATVRVITMADQDIDLTPGSGSFAASDAYAPGGTDVPVSDGGTGASSEGAARVNLGVEIGVDVQAYDADLDDLADGSLSGVKVGFSDPDSNFTATDLQAAMAELDDANGSGPNATDYKVNWEQIGNIPAGFADGSDDGTGGGGEDTTYEVLDGNGDVGFGASQVPQGSLVAPLASPALTGDPTVPTASTADSDTSAASTAFVQQELATQDECSEITGCVVGALTAEVNNLGTVSGTLPVANGGTGSTSAPNARTALGLAIGTNVQAFDADLTDLADGSLTGSKVGTGISGNNISTGTVGEPRISTALARLASPIFTGNPVGPTPTAGDNDTSLATTAFATGGLATHTAVASAHHTKTTDASELTSGLLPDARLNATIPRLAATQTFSGLNSFDGQVDLDGKTVFLDDSTATLAAVHAAVNTAGVSTVYLAAGATYESLTTANTYAHIEIPDNVTLDCQGAWLKQTDDTTGQSDAADSGVVSLIDSDNAHIRNCRIDGGFNAGQSWTGDDLDWRMGISCWGCTDSSIRNNYIRDTYHTGIYAKNYTDPVIDGNTMVDVGAAASPTNYAGIYLYADTSSTASGALIFDNSIDGTGTCLNTRRASTSDLIEKTVTSRTLCRNASVYAAKIEGVDGFLLDAFTSYDSGSVVTVDNTGYDSVGVARNVTIQDSVFRDVIGTTPAFNLLDYIDGITVNGVEIDGTTNAGVGITAPSRNLLLTKLNVKRTGLQLLRFNGTVDTGLTPAEVMSITDSFFAGSDWLDRSDTTYYPGLEFNSSVSHFGLTLSGLTVQDYTGVGIQNLDIRGGVVSDVTVNGASYYSFGKMTEAAADALTCDSSKLNWQVITTNGIDHDDCNFTTATTGTEEAVCVCDGAGSWDRYQNTSGDGIDIENGSDNTTFSGTRLKNQWRYGGSGYHSGVEGITTGTASGLQFIDTECSVDLDFLPDASTSGPADFSTCILAGAGSDILVEGIRCKGLATSNDLGGNTVCADLDAVTDVTLSDSYPDGSLASAYWPAGAFSSDGTQCLDPAEVTINSGPKMWTVICADNDASTVYGTTVMPDGYTGGTVTFELGYIQTASDTSALNADVTAQCRGAGETVSNTWGTEVAIDDAAVTGSNAVDLTTSAAVTPAGTCAGGDLLAWRLQLDATGTTTAVGTLNLVGMKMEYSATGGDE